VYGVNPLTPLDLIPIPNESKVSFEAETRAKEMKKLHEQIRNQIEKTNEAYKTRANKHRKALEFKPGDLVWLHHRKERFPSRRKSELMARSDGPFEVIEKIGDNAYKLQLPGDMAISATFNVGDLSPYVEDSIEDPSNLRANPPEDGEVDAGACDQGQIERVQGRTDQDQGAILALLSLSSSRAFTVLDDPFGGSNQVTIGRFLLCWTP